MNSGKSTLWLVKSNGNIMGPFAVRQVQDLLRERVIVPLDEVSRPCDRWNYIRDEPAFAKTVEEIRLRNMRGAIDDTTTQSEDATNATKTVSLNGESTDELTVEIAQNPSQSAQDILFHSIDDHIKPKSKPQGVVYANEKDVYIRRQAKEASSIVWVMTLVVLLAAGAFVGFRQFVAKPIQNKAVVDESISAGVNALELGEYDKALEYFNRAHTTAPNDSSLYLYLGILKIQIEGQPFLGRRLLEKLQERNDKDLKRVLTGIGIAYLAEGDAKNAETHFNRALDVDPLFGPAVINLGVAAMYSEDWGKASNHLQLSLKDGSVDGAEILMLIEVMAKLYEKEKDKRYLVEGLKYIEEFLKRNRNYHLEVLIGTIYLETLLGEKLKIYQKIEALLDLDFLETENHRQNLFIYRKKANWDLVNQWCLKSTQGLDPKAHVIAFEGLCLMKSGAIVEANRKIDDASAQSPKDPLVLSAYGFILREMNSNERAIVAIDKAIANDKEKKYEQPRRLKALYCRAMNDTECEKKIWQDILAKNPKSLAALAGLSRLYVEQRQHAEAKKYLQAGQKISKNYRPFFAIQKAVSSAEDREKARGL